MSAIFAKAVENATCPQCHEALQGAPLDSVTCAHCHQKVFVPGMLGQYRLTKKLGEGGMGAVYEGIDEGLQRKVAVKVILREKVDEDPSFLENFRREAQSAAKLNHPNIVAVYAFGEYEAQPFLAMELVQPDALDRMMAAQGMVLPATVLNIGYQIAQGLKAASEQGLIHGDVKPENVLINEAKEAKLADFGIAALMGKSANNEVWGTPYYIAPETLLKQKVDLRADIYSLGGTLYHAIAGVPPFEGPDAVAVMKARLEGPARDLREVAPGCPEEIAKIVMRMLEAEPMRRYPNYDSLLADMRKAISAAKASGGLGGKRIVIKGKTASAEMPSRPIPSVPINVPLTPPKAGLSKGMVAGIIGGIVFLFLAIIGGSILALMHVNSDSGKKDAPAETPVAEAQVAVAEPSHELLDLTEEANASAQALAKDVAQAGVLITQMRTKAQPMLFPEEEKWLTLQEAQPAPESEEASEEGATASASEATAETPPREILRKFQEALKLQAQLTEAATLRAELAKSLAALGEETPETLAKGKELVKTASKNAAVKQFSRNMATLKRMRAHWDDIVDNARKEKNQRVLEEREAEAQAKIAAQKQAELERQQEEIAREVTRAKALFEEFGREVDTFRLEEATKEYAERVKQLKSSQAKRAAKIGAERLEAFARVKQWLIESANKGELKPYRITAASENTVTLNGQAVEWRVLTNDKKLMVSIIRGRATGEGVPRVQAALALGLRQFMLRNFTPEEVNKSPALTTMMERLKEMCNERMLERLEASDSADTDE